MIFGLVTFGITALALLIEALFGYPDRLVRSIGHPVIWIGRLIGWLDRRWNRDGEAPEKRRRAGVAALAVLLAAAVMPALVVQQALLLLPYGLVFVAILASSLLAQRGLHEHVERVATALDTGGVAAGRAAVSHIVGRDPEALDEAGIARAALESLAENFSDAVVAPAFWMVAAGLPGAAAYKAVNTADSMIGHRSPRHLDFGRAAARLDDYVNLPASRLSGLLIVLAAALIPGTSSGGAFRAMQRDARLHRSPNAGWPEAALAGALGIALAGPRSYGGTMGDYAFMGRDGRREVDADDIRRGLKLYAVADALLVGIVVALALAMAYVAG
ncbi:adenosylcobinamide-phosphate synthase CbiB [Ancylobacter terrae]|uniref:adenosylcobinamide-phosphate synthase CbiB n=1 Tax=Ancylobacter sp. sgz301288 TaxID=3342077 RepID=UPI00385E1D54